MTSWKEIHQAFTPKLQKKWEAKGLIYEEAKELISIGLQPKEIDLVVYLKTRGCISKDHSNILWMIDGIGQLRKIYEEDFPNHSATELKTVAQEYLDYYYPKKLREWVYQLDLSEQKLVGSLNLKDFTRLEEVNITGNPQLEKIENKKQGVVIRLDARLQLANEQPKSEDFSTLEEKKSLPSWSKVVRSNRTTWKTLPISFSSTQEQEVHEESPLIEEFDSYKYYENNYFFSLFEEFKELLSLQDSWEAEQRWDRKKTWEDKIQQLKNSLASLKGDNLDYKRRMEKILLSNEELEKNNKGLSKRLSLFRSQVEELQDQLVSEKTQNAELTINLEKALKEKGVLQRQLNAINLRITRLQEEKTRKSHEQKQTEELHEQLKVKEKQSTDLQHQLLEQQKELWELQNEYQTYRKNNSQDQAEKDKKIKSLESKVEELNEKKNKLDDFQKKLAKLEQEKEQIQQQLSLIADIIVPNIAFEFNVLSEEAKKIKIDSLNHQLSAKKQELEKLTNNNQERLNKAEKYLLEKLLKKHDKFFQIESNSGSKKIQELQEGLSEKLTNEELQILLDKQKELLELQQQLDNLQNQQQAQILQPVYGTPSSSKSN